VGGLHYKSESTRFQNAQGKRGQLLTADAGHLVASIATVLLTVALPVDRDASSVGTPELCLRAGTAHCNDTQRDNSVLTVA